MEDAEILRRIDFAAWRERFLSDLTNDSVIRLEKTAALNWDNLLRRLHALELRVERLERGSTP